MATNIIMPSLGFDMTEGKIANWLKQEGDTVTRGQAIAEIETEKATVEIESTVAGTLRSILVPPGQTVPVGTVIALVAEPGESEAATSAPATALPQPAAAQVPPSELPTPEPERTSAPTNGPANGPAGGETRLRASPIARRMAREAGIDLAQLSGTGPAGRIMERDVKGAMAGRAPARVPAAPPRQPPGPQPSAAPKLPAAVTAPLAAAPAPPTPSTDGAVPLNKMRQAIARRMAESKATVPHFYVTFEIDMTNALKMREQLNALSQDETKISVNDLVVAAAARTLLEFPILNASYCDGALTKHPQINIGLAVALEDGLITPVLHDADKKSLRVIASEAKQLGERARANHLRADDLTGSTFTISNLGMFGADEFVAIINPPEAAILAVGAATKRPIVVNDTVQVAPIMKATVSVDHRVADGAQAARFMAALRRLLENPMNLLLVGS